MSGSNPLALRVQHKLLLGQVNVYPLDVPSVRDATGRRPSDRPINARSQHMPFAHIDALFTRRTHPLVRSARRATRYRLPCRDASAEGLSSNRYQHVVFFTVPRRHCSSDPPVRLRWTVLPTSRGKATTRRLTQRNYSSISALTLCVVERRLDRRQRGALWTSRRRGHAMREDTRCDRDAEVGAMREDTRCVRDVEDGATRATERRPCSVDVALTARLEAAARRDYIAGQVLHLERFERNPLTAGRHLVGT